MSNRLVVEPTEFKNLSNGEINLGVRVYDDYYQSYDNTWDEIPKNDMDILKKVMDMGNEVQIMLDHVKENQKGITIGLYYHDWDEIEKIMTEDA